MKLRTAAPARGVIAPVRHLRAWAVMCALSAMCVATAPAAAQPKRGKPDSAAKGGGDAKGGDAKGGGDGGGGAKSDAKVGGGKSDKVKTFDFTGIDLSGRMRTPQLLYFLERANEELERASLEKRSFIPHMVRSIEEEQL